MPARRDGNVKQLCSSCLCGTIRAGNSERIRNGVEQLKAVNAALKTRGVKGRLVVVRDRLFLRGTFTDSSGERKERKINLDVPAANVLEAESRAVALGAKIAELGHLPKKLPWEVEAPEFEAAEPGATAITVADAVEQLKADFWKGKILTTAAERSWERLEAETRRLPANATLTMDLMVAVGNSTEPGSRTRVEALKTFKRMAKLVGITGTERLDEIRTPYEPAPRDIPSDEAIAAFLLNLDRDHRWAWPTWALSTYGCRPCETFSLRENGDGTAQCLTVKRKVKLPTWRTALAIPLLDEFCARSVPWDVKAPKEYDSKEAKRLLDQWQGWLSRQAPGWQLYNLRHAWAIRSIRKGLNASGCAKTMGHSLDVHSRTYHREFAKSDVAAMAAQLKSV